VLRAVVLTQYRRVTDGRTDGIAVRSTALAMRALRRAVKSQLHVHGVEKIRNYMTRAVMFFTFLTSHFLTFFKFFFQSFYTCAYYRAAVYPGPRHVIS